MSANVTGGGIRYNASTSVRPELLEPSQPGEHVWVATVAFRLSPEQARLGDAGSAAVHLDKENIAFLGLGCFVCEEPFTPRLSYRRCKGEPRA